MVSWCKKGECTNIPKNQSYVGSSGQTLVTNVSMTLCHWQIRHQTHVLCGCATFVPKQIRNQINTVPTPAVAWTRAWLIQRGGGYIRRSHPRVARGYIAADPHGASVAPSRRTRIRRCIPTQHKAMSSTILMVMSSTSTGLSAFRGASPARRGCRRRHSNEKHGADIAGQDTGIAQAHCMQ